VLYESRDNEGYMIEVNGKIKFVRYSTNCFAATPLQQITQLWQRAIEHILYCKEPFLLSNLFSDNHSGITAL